MAKITLNDIVNTYNLALINSNFTKIEDEFQNKVLYRDNPSGEPNSMASSIDMNGNRILNLPAPQSMNEPARLADVSGLGDITALVQQAEQSADAALVSEQSAQAYAGQAAASAAGAASAAISAQTFAQGLIGSSTTSSDYTLGAKVFTTQTGKQFNPGQFITITDTTTPANYMLAQVDSYIGSILSVDVTAASGTGTWASWNISVSGIQGPQGIQGIQGPAGAPGGAVEVKDEGITLTSGLTSMDFVGAGVTATNTGGAVTVTIPGGGGGGSITTKDEGSNLTTATASLNFVGAGVTATNVGNDVTINIPSISLTGTTSIGGSSGSESLRVVQAPASSVNRVEITGNTTGNDPLIASNGTDTNVSLDIATKGTGVVSVSTNGTTEQFRVAHTASAVNYLQVTGAATTAGPSISPQGTDTNIDLVFGRKGTGSYNFNAPDSNPVGFELGNNATGDRNVFLDLHADTTNTDFSYRLQRTGGANNGVVYNQAGTGAHTFTTNGSTTNIQFGIAHTASAVNYVQYTGGATTVAPVTSAQGTDTNISLDYRTKGTGGFDIKQAAGGTTYLARVLGVSGTAANHFTIQGTVAAGIPSLAVAGTDTDISMRISSKGTGGLILNANGDKYTISSTGALASGAGTTLITGTNYNHQLRSYATGSLPSASTEGAGTVVRDSTTGELKMSNGTVWGAVGGSGGGSYTLLATINTSTASGTISAPNVFTSAYDDYEVWMDGLTTGGSGTTFALTPAFGGTVTATNNMFWVRTSSVNTTTTTSSSGSGSVLSQTMTATLPANVGLHGTIRIGHANSSASKHFNAIIFSAATGANDQAMHVSYGDTQNTNVLTGFQLALAAGNFNNNTGRVRIYGIKNT